MDMSKKQAEFFTVLIIICTVTAALILLIDFQIKGAILEESNRLRRVIERESAAADGSRPIDNRSDNPSYPADLVHSGNAGMEETSAYAAPNGTNPKASRRATKPQEPNGNS
jgi:hypothetical protein